MSDKIIIPQLNILNGIFSDPATGTTSVNVTDGGNVSDGWHTFNELYHYRMLYNAAFLNLAAYMADEYGMSDKMPMPVKSWRHSDGELCFGKDNYFVVVIQLPSGQVSNHYHDEYWDLFQIDIVERAPEWDGHTAHQAAERLEKYLRNDY